MNGKTYSPSYSLGPPGSATLGIQQPAPSNTSPPSLPASAQVGDTVTCNPGTWTGSPTFAFQWLRDGSPIAGATADTYTLVDADAGRSIVCRVTATNAGGDTDADSGPLVPTSPPPPPSPPVNTIAPTLPSAAEVGQTVTCDPGAWTGAPTFAFRWLRDGVEVASATAQSYRLTAADTGARIVCRVTATNADGSASADSAPLVPTARTETIRGDQAFAEGTANDLYLACTRLDLWLIDVLPRGRFTVAIPLPEGPAAALYRARTRAPTTTTGRIANVFTLPRALDLP